MTRINSHQVIQMLDDDRLVFVDDDTGVEVVMPIAQAKAIIDEIKGKLFDANTEFVFHDGTSEKDLGKNQVVIGVVHLPAAIQAIEYFATQAEGIKAAKAGTTPGDIAEIMNVPKGVALLGRPSVDEQLARITEQNQARGEDPYVLEEFFVTFGVQYGTGPNETVHPISPELSHNGWVVIEATDYDSARAIAFGVFGGRWSMIYTRLYFTPEDKGKFYPAGELGRIKVNIPIGRES